MYGQIIAACIASARIVAVQLGALYIDPPQKPFCWAPERPFTQQTSGRRYTSDFAQTHSPRCWLAAISSDLERLSIDGWLVAGMEIVETLLPAEASPVGADRC